MVEFTDRTWGLCWVLEWQRAGDGWTVHLAWGEWGHVPDGWFVHNPEHVTGPPGSG